MTNILATNIQFQGGEGEEEKAEGEEENGGIVAK